MVEQQLGIFREVTAVCRPLGRPKPHFRGGGSQGGR